MTDKFDAIIIGAGISGLTCAFNLHQKGKDVIVLEKSDHIGGAIKSFRADGYLVEAGPNSTLETTPLLRKLMNESGCLDKLQYASAASNTRYIVKNGKLTSLPMSPGAFIQTKLFSLSAKLRLFKEPFIPASSADAEETIAEFVLRRLGNEFLDYAINPFVAGVYAGSPEQLSVKAAFPKLHALEQKYGSLIKGQIKGAKERKRDAEQSKQSAKMFSYHDGMESLPKAISEKLDGKILTGCHNISIEKKNENFIVTYIVNNEPITYESSVVILSVPAYSASKIVYSLSNDVSRNLDSIHYPPCAVVVTGYKQENIRRSLDGFGYLIPQKEKRKILGTIFTSTIFNNRCPEGKVLLTSFVGGSRNPELALLPKDKLQQIVHQELTSLIGATSQPDFVHITQWEKAIPQYNIGHLDRMAVLDTFENEQKGFYFCANYRGGISVGDCVKSADEIAQRASEYLKKNSESRIQNPEEN